MSESMQIVLAEFGALWAFALGSAVAGTATLVLSALPPTRLRRWAIVAGTLFLASLAFSGLGMFAALYWLALGGIR